MTDSTLFRMSSLAAFLHEKWAGGSPAEQVNEAIKAVSTRIEPAKTAAPLTGDSPVKARLPSQDTSVNQRRRQIPRHEDAPAYVERPEIDQAGGGALKLHVKSPYQVEMSVRKAEADEPREPLSRPPEFEPPENWTQASRRRNSIALPPETMDWTLKREVGLEDDFDRLGNHVRPATVEKLANITDVRNRLHKSTTIKAIASEAAKLASASVFDMIAAPIRVQAEMNGLPFINDLLDKAGAGLKSRDLLTQPALEVLAEPLKMLAELHGLPSVASLVGNLPGALQCPEKTAKATYLTLHLIHVSCIALGDLAEKNGIGDTAMMGMDLAIKYGGVPPVKFEPLHRLHKRFGYNRSADKRDEALFKARSEFTNDRLSTLEDYQRVSNAMAKKLGIEKRYEETDGAYLERLGSYVSTVFRYFEAPKPADKSAPQEPAPDEA